MKEMVRRRMRFNREQRKVLEEAFAVNNHLSGDTKRGLAIVLQVQEQEVITWFRNKRARIKLNFSEKQNPKVEVKPLELSSPTYQAPLNANNVGYLSRKDLNFSVPAMYWSDIHQLSTCKVGYDENSKQFEILLEKNSYQHCRERIRFPTSLIEKISIDIAKLQVQIRLLKLPIAQIEIDDERSGSGCWFPVSAANHLQFSLSSSSIDITDCFRPFLIYYT